MYVIRFDRKMCMECGNCECRLPKAISHRKTEHQISLEDYLAYEEQIKNTQSKCFLDLITVELI